MPRPKTSAPSFLMSFPVVCLDSAIDEYCRTHRQPQDGPSSCRGHYWPRCRRSRAKVSKQRCRSRSMTRAVREIRGSRRRREGGERADRAHRESVTNCQTQAR